MRTKAEVISAVKVVLEDVFGSVTNKEAAAVTEGICSAIVKELEEGNEVVLPEIGKFSVVDTAARKGRNPQTGEEIQIPAGKRVKFSAKKALKEAIKK